MRVGVMLDDLGQNQFSFMAISFINTLISTKKYQDFTLLITETVRPVVRPLCITTGIDRCVGFDGMLIATNLYLASLLVNTVSRKKILYITDLWWLREKNAGNYLENLNILQNSELTLVARSESHADAVYNYCNRKVEAIIPNFNLLTMVETFDEEK